MNYAEAIKALRKKMLITQTELAAVLGVAFVSVNTCTRAAVFATSRLIVYLDNTIIIR